MMRSFMSCCFPKYYRCGQVSEDEMDGTCSMHDIREMRTKSRSENLKGRARSEDLGIDANITLDWILGK